MFEAHVITLIDLNVKFVPSEREQELEHATCAPFLFHFIFEAHVITLNSLY